MNEQKKYEIIKKLVETNGNKSRAAEPISTKEHRNVYAAKGALQ